MERDAHFQSRLLHVSWSPQYTRCNKTKSHLPLKFPVKGTPMERDDLFPEPLIHLFIHISQSPQLSHKMGKHKVTIHGAHMDRRPTYSSLRPGSLRGSFTTLTLLPQCQAAFSAIPSTLASVDQSPVSWHVS